MSGVEFLIQVGAGLLALLLATALLLWQERRGVTFTRRGVVEIAVISAVVLGAYILLTFPLVG